MTLEKCPWCGSEEVRNVRIRGGCCMCRICGMFGPDDDPNGEKWNSISRRVHGQPIPAQPETGPMPWRLAIAAQICAACEIGTDEVGYRGGEVGNAQYGLRRADALLAAFKAWEGGA